MAAYSLLGGLPQSPLMNYRYPKHQEYTSLSGDTCGLLEQAQEGGLSQKLQGGRAKARGDFGALSQARRRELAAGSGQSLQLGNQQASAEEASQEEVQIRDSQNQIDLSSLQFTDYNFPQRQPASKPQPTSSVVKVKNSKKK